MLLHTHYWLCNINKAGVCVRVRVCACTCVQAHVCVQKGYIPLYMLVHVNTTPLKCIRAPVNYHIVVLFLLHTIG